MGGTGWDAGESAAGQRDRDAQQRDDAADARDVLATERDLVAEETDGLASIQDQNAVERMLAAGFGMSGQWRGTWPRERATSWRPGGRSLMIMSWWRTMSRS
jgi:hypothetical protein